MNIRRHLFSFHHNNSGDWRYNAFLFPIFWESYFKIQIPQKRNEKYPVHHDKRRVTARLFNQLFSEWANLLSNVCLFVIRLNVSINFMRCYHSFFFLIIGKIINPAIKPLKSPPIWAALSIPPVIPRSKLKPMKIEELIKKDFAKSGG